MIHRALHARHDELQSVILTTYPSQRFLSILAADPECCPVLLLRTGSICPVQGKAATGTTPLRCSLYRGTLERTTSELARLLVVVLLNRSRRTSGRWGDVDSRALHVRQMTWGRYVAYLAAATCHEEILADNLPVMGRCSPSPFDLV